MLTRMSEIYKTAKINPDILAEYKHQFCKMKESRKMNISDNTPDISVCGTDCSVCYCFGKMCTGCNACSGKVFHAPEGSACPIYECTVNRKGFKNCGECAEAPCGIWMKTRDPKFSDEEFAENVKTRMDILKGR